MREHDEIIQEVIDVNQLPMLFSVELKKYYSGIPYFSELAALESEVFILARYIFDSNNFDIDQRSISFAPVDHEPEIRKDDADSFSYLVIESRYQNEEELLDAIRLGDAKKALARLAAFNKFKVESRFDDRLRDSKNYLISFNSLMRKAVHQADVHPAHIHNTSTYFVNMIERARNADGLVGFTNEMIRKYCMLVKNHSLSSYSKPIQKALNHIDFNFTEQLNLELLSGVAELTSSYLSTQFKKETGISVIDYINQKRIQRAQLLLITTNLPINKISELSGFWDDTYFARMFKKHSEKTPSEYRRLFKNQSSESTQKPQK
jgi:YesN/AraC family two-component response regulator